jgi:RNA polymerase sigma-70 factor (ECF subfamily)
VLLTAGRRLCVLYRLKRSAPVPAYGLRVDLNSPNFQPQWARHEREPLRTRGERRRTARLFGSHHPQARSPWLDSASQPPGRSPAALRIERTPRLDRWRRVRARGATARRPGRQAGGIPMLNRRAAGPALARSAGRYEGRLARDRKYALGRTDQAYDRSRGLARRDRIRSWRATDRNESPPSGQKRGTVASTRTPPIAADPRARFERIYEEQVGKLLAYAMRRTTRDTAEEIVAETFLIAWRRLGEIPEGDILPWLYGVARRVLANTRRSEIRHTALLSRLTIEAKASPRSLEQPSESRAIRALAGLPGSQREVLMLTTWEGLSAKQASKVLGCSETAFRLRLHRAKRNFEARLRGLEGATGLREIASDSDASR